MDKKKGEDSVAKMVETLVRLRVRMSAVYWVKMKAANLASYLDILKGANLAKSLGSASVE